MVVGSVLALLDPRLPDSAEGSFYSETLFQCSTIPVSESAMAGSVLPCRIPLSLAPKRRLLEHALLIERNQSVKTKVVARNLLDMIYLVF